MNRQNRVSHESMSSVQTDDPDFYIDNIVFISPESIYESIFRSTILTDFDKTCIEKLLWLLFSKLLQKDVAKHCILQILRSDRDVYDSFVDYSDRCEIFDIS